MNTENKIRQLAKSNYWQSIYFASKESSIELFENKTNLTSIQVRFLYWLQTYSMLYEELAKHEDKLLTEKVIDDNTRTDAYLYYRHKKYDYLFKKYKREEQLAEIRSRQPNKHKSDNAQLIEVDLKREE